MTEQQYMKATKINIGVLVTIILFVATHLSASLWWASTITARQDFLIQQIQEIKMTIEKHTVNEYTRAEAGKDFINLDKRIIAVETRVDRLEQRNVKTP